MQNENTILKLSKAFALRIIKLYRFLTEEKREFIIAKQVCRSGTSIGANIAESKNAQSTADYISKLSIALKEADETEYWLDLLYESDTIDQMQYESIVNDVRTLIGTLINIIKRTKENKERGKL